MLHSTLQPRVPTNRFVEGIIRSLRSRYCIVDATSAKELSNISLLNNPQDSNEAISQTSNSPIVH
jgi:hypothetical protein